MKSLIRAIVYVFLAIYNGIQVVTGGLTLKKMMPTGVINQGILGGFSGKVGPVVGGKWKDIDYMRSYVIPANPDTLGQQAVRAKFAALVAEARQLLSSVLQPFWDLFYSNMSGFNAWISQNYALADSDGILDENAVMAKGTLESSASSAGTYNATNGNVVLSYSATIIGNGLTSDVAAIVVYDSSTGRMYIDTSAATRDDGEAPITIETGLTPGDLYAYVFFYRGTGSDLVVSDSFGRNLVAE